MPESLRNFLLSSFVPLLFTSTVMGLLALALSSYNGFFNKGRSQAVWPTSRLFVVLGVSWNVMVGLLFLFATSLSVLNGIVHSLVVLSVPPAVAAVALIPRMPRSFVAVSGGISLLLAILSFLSGFSIGIPYILSALLVAVGGVSCVIASNMRAIGQADERQS